MKGPSLGHRAIIASLSLLPRNAVSRAAGFLVSRRLPRFLRGPVMRAYAAIFGADLSEVRDPLDSFASIQDFFVRSLKDGARPVDQGPGKVISPCDGAWGQWGAIENGTLMQIKGKAYSLAELLADEGDARRFEGGVYATLYLSPKDYHRFHMPVTCRLEKARYIPGSLWPVNAAGLHLVDRLFARNERICAFWQVAEDGFRGELCMVAVGATMVGKTKVVFDKLETNVADRGRQDRIYEHRPVFSRGQEWGRFLFGSTIILLAERGALELDGGAPGATLRLGRPIGRLSGSLEGETG